MERDNNAYVANAYAYELCCVHSNMSMYSTYIRQHILVHNACILYLHMYIQVLILVVRYKPKYVDSAIYIDISLYIYIYISLYIYNAIYILIYIYRDRDIQIYIYIDRDRYDNVLS